MSICLSGVSAVQESGWTFPWPQDSQYLGLGIEKKEWRRKKLGLQQKIMVSTANQISALTMVFELFWNPVRCRCGFCICEFACSLKFTCNPQINIHNASMVISDMHRAMKIWVTQRTCSQLRSSKVMLCAFLFQIAYCKQVSFSWSIYRGIFVLPVDDFAV